MMFKNVLIAEDHESASISVRKTLADLGVPDPDFAYYCDEALKRVTIELRNKRPYGLLVTDLFFEPDDNPQRLADGEALIRAVRQVQPDLKVLVFSAEHRAGVIEPLFEGLKVDGYVRKARHDAQELRTAIETIFSGKVHYPTHLRQVTARKNAYDFTELDVMIITLLSQGVLQKNIPDYLQQKNMQSSALRSVEKRLKQMRDALNFSKNEQLVIFCKDMGII
ncbi:two-component system capsular synthesis response regulator RcsB [Mucilaginibacter sp. OAE612]|uniref:response regulator n=1 Tax=Mucilaginibacter sp. OAE612 TaxID=3156444 RepID=UPI00359EF5E5